MHLIRFRLAVSPELGKNKHPVTREVSPAYSKVKNEDRFSSAASHYGNKTKGLVSSCKSYHHHYSSKSDEEDDCEYDLGSDQYSPSTNKNTKQNIKSKSKSKYSSHK